MVIGAEAHTALKLFQFLVVQRDYLLRLNLSSTRSPFDRAGLSSVSHMLDYSIHFFNGLADLSYTLGLLAGGCGNLGYQPPLPLPQ